MKKRIYLQDRTILLKDIKEIVVNNIKYNNNIMSLYLYLKINNKKISLIKTENYIYRTKNGKLHCLEGPAIKNISKDDKIRWSDQYYIDGIFYFAFDFFMHEKRLKYIKRKEYKQKFKNIII